MLRLEFRLSDKMAWSIVSNVVLKSNRVCRQTFPESRLTIMSLKTRRMQFK